MARLVIPEDFLTQQTLLTNIKAKYDAASPNELTPYLTAQHIVLDDDVSAGVAAATHETSRALLSKQKENYRQLRDNRFNAVWKQATGSVQFLKSLFRGNVHELGNWGITVDGSNRISYPPDFGHRADLFKNFAAKSLSYPAGESPLQPYLSRQGINISNAVDFTNQSIADNENFNDAERRTEEERQLRDNLWLPVMAHIRGIGDYLMKFNSDNARAVGLWGFVVDDSPQKPKLRTTKLIPGETITSNGIVLGSTLTNTGETDIHVYRGKTTTGTPAIIHAGEQMGILKGFSSITVVNPSTLKEAKFTILIVN